MRAPYAQQISAVLNGRNYSPSHVEAFMRVEHPTLDGLSASRFRQEVDLACACIDEGGLDMAERIAASFGLGGAK